MTRDEALVVLNRAGILGRDAETALDSALIRARTDDPAMIAKAPLAWFNSDSVRVAVVLRRHLERSGE